MSSYIDTRVLATELDELQERQDAIDTAAEDLAAGLDEDDLEELDPLTEEETERLQALRDLADEVGSEFYYGETMIPVDSFEDYAQELAEDIGAIDRDASWPLCHIDWTAAAASLAIDYTEVELEGTAYYVRAS